jgi:hypothetical protein
VETTIQTLVQNGQTQFLVLQVKSVKTVNVLLPVKMNVPMAQLKEGVLVIIFNKEPVETMIQTLVQNGQIGRMFKIVEILAGRMTTNVQVIGFKENGLIEDVQILNAMPTKNGEIGKIVPLKEKSVKTVNAFQLVKTNVPTVKSNV